VSRKSRFYCYDETVYTTAEGCRVTEAQQRYGDGTFDEYITLEVKE